MSPSRIVRVYLPLDAAAVAQLRDRGVLAAASPAFAVTPRLARAAGAAQTEELEYAALLAAAAHAGQARGLARVRRVVAAADVAAAAVAEPLDPLEAPLAAVRLLEPLLRRQVASFHVDELPGGTADEDLMWYDATELETVLDQLEDLR